MPGEPNAPVIVSPAPRKWFLHDQVLEMSGTYASSHPESNYPLRIALHERRQEDAAREGNDYELDPPIREDWVEVVNGAWDLSWNVSGYCLAGMYYVISATVPDYETGNTQQHRIVLLCMPEDVVTLLTPVPGNNILPGPGQLTVTFRSTAAPRCPHVITLCRDGNPAVVVRQDVPAGETGFAIPLPADPVGTAYRLRVAVRDPNIYLWPADDNVYCERVYVTGDLPPQPPPGPPPIPPAQE